MFEPDRRKQNRNIYKGTTLEESIILSGGDMRLKYITMSMWIDYFKDLILSTDMVHTFRWKVDTLNTIVYALKQNN